MDRPVKLTVNNNTSKVLKLGSNKLEHGKFIKVPPAEIKDSGEWKCNCRDQVAIGPEGTVTYTMDDNPATKIEFYFNHPVGTATSSYRVNITPSGSFSYDIQGPFTGKSQEITFEIYER